MRKILINGKTYERSVTMTFMDALAFLGHIVGIVAILYIISFIYKWLRATVEGGSLTAEDAKFGIFDLVDMEFHSLALPCVLIAAIAVIIISHPAVQRNTNSYDIYELPDGTYCYYVTADNGSNEYTLPAQISVINDSFTDERDHTVYTCKYYLERIYFTNGGYLHFEYADFTPESPFTVTDQDEQEWHCTVLNKHAYSPYIEENNDYEVSGFSIFCLVVEVAALLITLLVYVWALRNTKHNTYDGKTPPKE